VWPSETASRPHPFDRFPFRTRTVRFDDLPEVLRLIRRAVERGCREHYDAQQRQAVYVSYASTLFGEALEPFETIAAELQEQQGDDDDDGDGDGEGATIIGFAQLDPASGRLRALFVDAELQQRGIGRTLLAEVEARALKRGCASINGAMSLNAVPFYQRAGFRPCAGPERLTTAGVHVPIVRMKKDLR
jgi:GNAT superfamily N-acetyltransferase